MKSFRKITYTAIAVAVGVVALLSVIGAHPRPSMGTQTMTLMSPSYGGRVGLMQVRYPSGGGAAKVWYNEYRLDPQGPPAEPPSGPPEATGTVKVGSATEIDFGSNRVVRVIVRGHEATVVEDQIGSIACRQWALTTAEGFRDQVRRDNDALRRGLEPESQDAERCVLE